MNDILKLKIDDIRILSAGEQIKNEILKTGRSVEEFAKEIDLYPVSVKQYLRRPDGGSATFKIKLMQTMDKSYDEIVKEPDVQLSEINQSISENIHLYCTEDDIEVLNHMEQLIEEHSVQFEIPWVLRNNAMNKFYRNEVAEAIAMLESALDKVRRHKDSYGLMLFSADLGLMYYYRFEYEKARAHLEKALEIMDNHTEVSSKMKFLVYFRNGIVFNHLNQYDQAKKFFELALENSIEETFKGLALMNKGVAESKLGNEEEAKGAFRDALIIFEGDAVRQSFVYNNFAELYMDQNDYERAIYFVEKAMECCGEEDILYNFQYFEMYARIQMKLGRDENVVRRLLNLIEQASTEFVYRDKIIGALNLLLEYLDENATHLINDIETVILSLINKTEDTNSQYKKELKSLLGEFFLKTRYFQHTS